MKMGQMRDKITIKGATTAKDGTGADVLTETTVGTVWADVMAVRGSESPDGGRLTSKQAYLVRIRALSGIDTSNHVVINGNAMQIRSISDRWQQHACRQGLYLWLDIEDGTEV